MLTKEKKKEIVAKWGKTQRDTGKNEVQVALISANMENLSRHFKSFPKDKYSQRGLLKLIGQRRRLLNYIKAHDMQAYKKLVDELGLRK